MNRVQTSNAFFIRTMADCLAAISSPVIGFDVMTMLVRMLTGLPRAISRKRYS